jgi:hypothetical protein
VIKKPHERGGHSPCRAADINKVIIIIIIIFRLFWSVPVGRQQLYHKCVIIHDDEWKQLRNKINTLEQCELEIVFFNTGT